MRVRLQPLQLGKPTVLHSVLRSSSSYRLPLCLRLQRRSITAEEKPLPQADKPGPGPNQEQLPHVSEEAAAIGKITGEGGPELEQGTPVQEVLKRDQDSQEKAPKVLQEQFRSSILKGSRPFSTSTRRYDQALMAYEANEVESPGHYFELPTLPLPRNLILKSKSKVHANIIDRYEPLIRQFTNLLMEDGKLSTAQRNVALILQILRTSPPPNINPQRPLIEGAPPASHLPLDPIRYLTLIIDSVAPLLRIRSQKGAAGGGVALQIPIPLEIRQRRRQAMIWILDAACKRRTKGSGRGGFARKIAEELISIAEGKSGVWERRGGVHKLGVSARANLAFRRR